MNKLITSFVLFTLVFNVEAQKNNSNNKTLFSETRISEYTGKIQYANLADYVKVPESTIKSWIENFYEFKNYESLVLLRTEIDDLGFTHSRFQYQFNGIPVLGSVIIAHSKNGLLNSFNGEIFTPDSKFLSLQKLPESLCLENALSITNAKLYKWQDPQQEIDIKHIKEDEKATWFPTGTLIFSPQNGDFSSDLHLCYEFSIFADEPLIGQKMYIDAENGKLVGIEEIIHTADVPGKAVTKYSGIVNMMTDSTAPGAYRLREKSRGNGIETYNMKKGTSYGASVDFTDPDNYWNNVNANKDEVATDAHWGAQMTYDYFKTNFNRNSYNNAGAKIISYVHYSVNYDNAFWNGSYMTYGDGNTFKPLTSIDVCGHEVTHAVTTYSAGLIYSYESGALNESFSDIFGNTIERYARPTQYSWKIGEDITTTGTGLRNMLNPLLKGHPRCYKGTSWYAGAGDNGGVHTNSGVQNWWYYLITEGGKGTNDFAQAFKVDSLGIISAGKIAYRNLTVYLTASSKYADARFYSIKAATDLFGDCSKEVVAVTNAWYAAGVGPKFDSGFVKSNFIADTFICNKSTGVKFMNLSSNAKSYKWYFGNGDTSNTKDPIYVYPAYGVYNIKLLVRSCFINKYDSLTKLFYVKVDSTLDICNAIKMPLTGKDSTSKCQSFIYDDGGEDFYAQLRTTYLKIFVPGADSISIKFSDFDYEKGFDSLYIYSGNIPGGIKVGGFTGTTLPNAGNTIMVAGNTITLKHKSDPLLTGRGFKLFYKAYRKKLLLSLGSDTTICNGGSAILSSKISGSYLPDVRYLWSDNSTSSNLIVFPTTKTTYKLIATDDCNKDNDSAKITVKVLPPIKTILNADTTICLGGKATLKAKVTGGDSLNYSYLWNNSLPNNSTQIVSPSTTTTYMLITRDGCTAINDSDYIKVTVLPALKATASANDLTLCTNQKTTFNASGSGGDSTKYVYTWNQGLGIGKSKTTAISASGWYKVTISDGCTVLPASDSVYITLRTPLQVSLNNDTTICLGSSVNLNTISTGGISSSYSYAWNQGLPANSSNSVSPSVLTKYKVTLSDGCSPAVSDSIYVDLLKPLKISNLKDTTICKGTFATLNPTGSGGLLSSHVYSWDNGLGNGSLKSTNPTSTITYRLILTDKCTVKNDTAFVIVNVLPDLNIIINTAPSNICLGDSAEVELLFSGGQSTNYKWFVDGVASTKFKFKVSPPISKDVKIDLQDNCSTPATNSSKIIVNPIPKTDFIADKTDICEGDQVQFTDQSIGGLTYLWTFSSNDISPNQNPQFKFKNAGTYSVKLKTTNAFGCADSLIKIGYINVVPYPVASFNFTPKNANIIVPDITFTNTSVGFTSFEWHFGDGTNDFTQSMILHSYRDTGKYKTLLIVSNNTGCKDTAFATVSIKDTFIFYLPNALSPNEDLINETFLPKGRGIKEFELQVFNRWGHKVFENRNTNLSWNGKDMDGNKLQEGVYIVIVTIKDFQNERHIFKQSVTIVN